MTFRRISRAFEALIDRVENPFLDEGAESLITLYQDNLLSNKDVEGNKSIFARAISRRSNILFKISESFLYNISNSKQKIEIVNKIKSSGLLNTRYKYAGFDSKRKYLNIFLESIYKSS